MAWHCTPLILSLATAAALSAAPWPGSAQEATNHLLPSLSL
jgi:hypothetical protein